MRPPRLERYDLRTVLVLGLLSALKAAALVGVADALARGIVVVIGSHGAAATGDLRDAIALGLAAALLRALTTWASQAFATRAAIGAKEALRHDLAARMLAGSDASVGAATSIGTVGLDQLDNYYRAVLPSVVTAATVPLLVGARILLADWVSAVIIVVTVPLVPLFMSLVGRQTRERADAASATLQRLSDHLVELARGLPVLVALGRVDDQAAALDRVSQRHRETTMATLRSAFLSSLVLEIISTISVAVVAVFVGLRLVAGEMPLEIGLIALILAPECFAPFRELGSAFHAAQDGLAAQRSARELIDAPVPAGVQRTDPSRDGGAHEQIRVRGLTVRYAGRAAAVDRLDLTIESGTVFAIEGVSGSGKSTVLGALAGVVPAIGLVDGIDPQRVAWAPQHPRTVAATVRDELALYCGDATESVDPAASEVADLALTAIATVVARLGLAGVVDSDPARISPGELRRLSVARALLRVAAGANILILDEPTADLDPMHARLVEQIVDELRGRVTILVASHEEGMTRLADRRVVLGARSVGRTVAEADVATSDPPESAEPSAFNTPRASGAGLAELLAFVRPTLWRMLLSVILGIGAALFAVALIALSGWLIVRASEQPPIMYLTVAIVGVRFFGLGRAGLRYAERLATHDAVLGSVAALRQRLWAGLARNGVASRTLTTAETALDLLVASADRVRDLVPRVVLPATTAVGVGIAAVVAIGILDPGAMPLMLGVLVASLIVAPLVALAADRSATRSNAVVRTRVLRLFTAMVAASGDLRANGIGPRMLARLDALDSSAGAHARSGATALGLGNGIVGFAGAAASALMLSTTAGSGIPDTIVAVLVLLPLAMIEPLTGMVDAVQQWPALAEALARVRSVTAEDTERSAAARARVGTIDELELNELWVGWAGSRSFGPITASARRGDWIVVEGPSGSGKSTLLATLMGFIDAKAGNLTIDGVDAAQLDAASVRTRISWCPQETHLFDSTIRGNLLLARAHGDRPIDDRMLEALTTAGLGPLLARLPDGLDTRIGPAGGLLSGGERQRLAVARALLSDSDVVLLDEPTAHLDAANADRLMSNLRLALADRIVVLVSHHDDERLPADARATFAASVT